MSNNTFVVKIYKEQERESLLAVVNVSVEASENFVNFYQAVLDKLELKGLITEDGDGVVDTLIANYAIGYDCDKGIKSESWSKPGGDSGYPDKVTYSTVFSLGLPGKHEEKRKK
ncbi:hypothetical protein JY481_10720 [Serratia marcescens]|uniref:hypothetical protein n=1 Tax=Serratia TaxID=613 RepID=UPI0012AEC2D8|nr:hypothetical protein [Serratia marcescens]MBN5334932.1 hypothetical protein [Serratia marcescens]MBN5340759.1 hypothetical protein [Serratia marcescens]HEJ7830125.1 hypothetical protein [Serratia marcescens]